MPVYFWWFLRLATASYSKHLVVFRLEVLFDVFEICLLWALFLDDVFDIDGILAFGVYDTLKEMHKLRKLKRARQGLFAVLRLDFHQIITWRRLHYITVRNELRFHNINR